MDDHVVVGSCDRSVADDPGALHDTALLGAGVTAYAAAGLPVAAEKRFRLQTECTAWGTEVSSERGTAGAPLERRLQMFHLVCLVFGLPDGNKVAFPGYPGGGVSPVYALPASTV